MPDLDGDTRSLSVSSLGMDSQLVIKVAGDGHDETLGSLRTARPAVWTQVGYLRWNADECVMITSDPAILFALPIPYDELESSPLIYCRLQK